MERKNFAVLCAAVLCFWLFALALGTAEGVGLRAVMHPEERAVSADVEEAAEGILLPTAAAAPQLDLNCRAAILIEQGSGRVLYEKNADERVPIASITKVMTLLLAFEAVHDGRLTMETPVPVSEHAYHMGGSQIWLEPGEHFTLDEMIKAICVSSANDAAVAVAELVGGSEPAFVEQMNQRAQQLGCVNTHFADATGLSDLNHYSSAWDIYLITREAMKHDVFMTIVNTKAYTVPVTNMTDTERELHSTNALISNWRMTGYLYSGAQGIKTGFTTAAGLCLVSSAVRGSRTLVSVVLGCEEVKTETGGTRSESFSETARLFDWGFDNFSARTVLESNELICEVPVALSNEVSTVAVHPASNAEAVLPNDLELDQLQRTVTLDNDSVNAPVAAGDQLGTITISYDGVDYVTVPLLAVVDVSASSFLLAKYNIGQFFSRTPVKIITIVVVLLVIAALVWFRLYGRTRRYGRSGRRYRHHAYRGRRR